MKSKLLLHLAILICICATSNAYVWTQKSNFGAGNRAGAFYFSVGAKGYMGSGIYQSGTSLIYIADFWEYDPALDAWTQKATFSGNPRSTASGFSINGKGYIVNGYTGVNYLNQTQEYDPVTNSWTIMANFPGAARYTCASFVLNNEGYVGMGKSGGFYSDFYKFNPAANTWTTVAAIPGAARQNAKGFAVNNFGYVVGGAAGSGNYYMLYQYDPAMNSWMQKTSYPGQASYAMATFVLNGLAYVGTGAKASSSANTFSDFYSYDAITDTWSPVIAFGGGIRNSTAYFEIGNKAYVGTGSTGVYPTVVNYMPDWWEFSSPTGINDHASAISANVFVSNGQLIVHLDKNVSRELSFRIFDLTGKEVAVRKLAANTAEITIDFSNMAKGIYTYSIADVNNRLTSGKFLK